MTSRPTDDAPSTFLAAAYREDRPAVARSHRLHRPRGGFCARGYCEQCPVRTEDGVALACELAATAVGRRAVLDPLRPLGRLGEWATPWFWERRFRRPRAMRQMYLRSLRHLSAALPLPPDRAAGTTHAETIETDILVVGGGPAGLAASARAVAGGHRVTVLSRGGTPSSALEPAIAARLDADRTIVEEGGSFVDGAVCLGIGADAPVGLYRRGSGVGEVRFERLIVATGAYDRLPLVRGNDLPGVIGIRAFERLAADGAFGRKGSVAIVATGMDLERAQAAAERFGVPVADEGPVDTSEEALVRVLGRRRVRGVELSSGRRVRAAVLVVGGMQPTYELQVHAGLVPTVLGLPSEIVTRGQARFPLLAVGEAAGPVDHREAQARAHDATAMWLEGSGPVISLEIDDIEVDAGSPTATERRPAPDPRAYVCLCEDVRVADVERAIGDGYDRLEHLKRRTGATTGPCQGKLCFGALCDVVSAHGLTPAVPRVRPPIRPVEIAALGGDA